MGEGLGGEREAEGVRKGKERECEGKESSKRKEERHGKILQYEHLKRLGNLHRVWKHPREREVC